MLMLATGKQHHFPSLMNSSIVSSTWAISSSSDERSTLFHSTYLWEQTAQEAKAVANSSSHPCCPGLSLSAVGQRSTMVWSTLTPVPSRDPSVMRDICEGAYLNHVSCYPAFRGKDCALTFWRSGRYHERVLQLRRTPIAQRWQRPSAGTS